MRICISSAITNLWRRRLSYFCIFYGLFTNQSMSQLQLKNRCCGNHFALRFYKCKYSVRIQIRELPSSLFLSRRLARTILCIRCTFFRTISALAAPEHGMPRKPGRPHLISLNKYEAAAVVALLVYCIFGISSHNLEMRDHSLSISVAVDLLKYHETNHFHLVGTACIIGWYSNLTDVSQTE